MASADDPENAIAKISKGSDKKQDLMLIMDAHNKWDHFFLPAPMSICLLGQLLMITSDRDISLRDREPPDGFKYLKFPDSFRACLVQISDGGWSAFNQAHSSMDQIRLHTAGVETHVRNALKLLLGGTLSEIDLVVPMSLNKVSEIADVCKCLAERTESKFFEVMHICNELLEACTAAKDYYEEKARKTQRDIERKSSEKERLEKWGKIFEAELRKQEDKVKKAEIQFEKNLRDMPSTGSVVGIHLAQAFINTVTSALSVFSLSNLVPPDKEVTKNTEKEAESKSYEITDRNDSLEALNMIPHIKEIGKFFKSDGMLNLKELADGIAHETQKILESDQKNFVEDGRKNKNSLKKIINEAVSICRDVNNHTEIGKKDSETEKKIYKRFQKLKKAANTLEARANKDASYPLSAQPSVCRGSVKKGNTLTEDVVENARFKTEIAKANLEEAQKRRDEMFANLLQENEKLHKTLVELKTLDITKIDFDEIQRILREGLAALAQVRTQWEKLCQFFQMISNVIKVSLNHSLTSFVSCAKGGAELRLKKEIMSETYKNILIGHATEANRIAFVVQNISTAYVEISAKHLMPGITSLGGLLHLDPVNDRKEMALKREELQYMMERTQDDITSLIEKNKRDFDCRLNTRINDIEKEVEAILPQLPAQKVEEIKETVRDGFIKDDDELEQKLDDLL